MGKFSKKLIVYLDQNFIINIAKADISERVDPHFKVIYELLHQGFVEEKIVVPKSWFHKVETSLIPDWKKRINQYQGYLGQISLNHPEEIYTFQLVMAAREFLKQPIESTDYNIAYHDNPDKRIQRFNINIDTHLESSAYIRNDRIINAQELNKIREFIQKNKVTYRQQCEKELEARRKYLFANRDSNIGWLFKNDTYKIKEFIWSDNLAKIPSIDIYCKMWARTLVSHNIREIQTGDQTDIDIISKFLPYVDVLATDTFMANMVGEFHFNEDYDTKIFNSGKEGLKQFEDFLKDYITSNSPVNQPIVSIFVLPDEKIRHNSFSYFKKLGLMAIGIHELEGYVELYAFDDGSMPQYPDRLVSSVAWPFYGLQDVDPIKVKKDEGMSEILKICQSKSKSNTFVLIDTCRKLPDNFIVTLVDYVKAGKNRILGYQIYTKII